MSKVAINFSLDPLSLGIGQILPSRAPPERLLGSRKYGQIKTSIAEIGLIEPLVVTAVAKSKGQYLLLDGHVRLLALKELGHTVVPCLLTGDDETYTYNTRINRLATVQEHVMIRRAVDRGVPPERIAKVLDVNVLQIVKKAHLLDGICPEAIDLLRYREFSVELGRILGKMKPNRQVEAAELMLSANNMTITYASALLAATPAAALVESKRSRKMSGVTPEQMIRMEREMKNLRAEYQLVDATYGQDVLNLVLAQRYIAKLLENARVTRYLQPRHSDLLEQFIAIRDTNRLDA